MKLLIITCFSYIVSATESTFDDPQSLLNQTQNDPTYANSQMKAIGEYFGELMGCGPAGWCAFRCCPPTQKIRRYQPMPSKSFMRSTSSRTESNKWKPKPIAVTCANACMPLCTQKCIQRYNQIVSSFMTSLTSVDVMGYPAGDNIRLSPAKKTECTPQCMPYCTSQCVADMSPAHSPPKFCKSSCMPTCNEECVHAPPLMTPCIFNKVCHCPPGYVRCSESTCCMRYKAMAIRYKNRMTSFKFSDDHPNIESKGNETAVYMEKLKKMGNATEITSTVVYYPEQGKAEILLNDGTSYVENVDDK